MAGFFDNLMGAVNKIEKAVDTAKKLRNELDKINTPVTSRQTAQAEPLDTKVSDMKTDYSGFLTEEYYSFEFDGTSYRYKLYKPTNFFIANDDFGAAEVCNGYFFSQNGQEPEGFWNWNLEKFSSHTQIYFGEWEYDVEKMKDRLDEVYLKNHGVKGCKAETVNREDIVFKVSGENNNTYYESYFFKTEGLWEDETEPHENYFQIALSLNKKDLSEEQLCRALSEFRSIIDTLEWSCSR